MTARNPSLIDIFADEVDLSNTPGYIKDYVPENDLRRRLALNDPRLIAAARRAIDTALKYDHLVPLDALDIVYFNSEQAGDCD